MHWYRIVARDEDGDGHLFVGSSELSPEELAATIDLGRMVRLENMVYKDEDGEVRDWETWDDSVYPTLYISSRTICSFMELRRDPRDAPAKTAVLSMVRESPGERQES